MPGTWESMTALLRSHMSRAILNACERRESLAGVRLPTKSVSRLLRTLTRPSQAIQLGCFNPSSGPTLSSVSSPWPCVNIGADIAIHVRATNLTKCQGGNILAERVGFEPTSRLLVNTLSKRAPSATRTPLRGFAPRAPGSHAPRPRRKFAAA